MRAVAVLLVATTAHADVRVDVSVEASLLTPLAHPLALAPDIWWGATPRLTIGLIHSSQSLDQIDARSSFCLRSGDYGCEHFYLGSGIDARYQILDGAVQLSPRVRALVRDVDPFKPAITVGALIHYPFGDWSLTSDPYLQVGLANTDEGNRAQLWLPLFLQWKFLWLHTGYNAELANAGDAYHIPIALGGRYQIDACWGISLEAGFASLLGPQNTPKDRTAILTVTWQRR